MGGGGHMPPLVGKIGEIKEKNKEKPLMPTPPTSPFPTPRPLLSKVLDPPLIPGADRGGGGGVGGGGGGRTPGPFQRLNVKIPVTVLIFWIKYAPNCGKMHLKFQKFKSFKTP